MRRAKILKIEMEAPKFARPLDHASYIGVSKELLEKGVRLPKWNWLELYHSNMDEIRVLLEDCTMKIHLKNRDGVIVIVFKKGWITDFASVPSLARGIIDNDAIEVIKASMPHDYGYGSCIYTRKWWDLLFYDILRYEGYGIIRSGLAYRALRIGAASHWENKPALIQWSKTFVKFERPHDA